MSANGTRFAAGAEKYSDNGKKVNSGQVLIYEFVRDNWVRIGELYGDEDNDSLGAAVAMYADGSIVAVGAHYNDGNGVDSGQVRVYEYSG
jgi:hypothetical protein